VTNFRLTAGDRAGGTGIEEVTQMTRASGFEFEETDMLSTAGFECLAPGRWKAPNGSVLQATIFTTKRNRMFIVQNPDGDVMVYDDLEKAMIDQMGPL